MFRGTTPTFYFKIKNIDDLTTIKDIWITFRNKDKLYFVKKYSDGDVDISTTTKLVSVNLDQEETLSFAAPCVKMQLKVQFTDDKVCMSPIFSVPINNPLNAKIMVDEEDEEVTEDGEETDNEVSEDTE